MKQLWRCNIANLNYLMDKASNITISMTGIDYNYEYDHEYYDTIPSFLFFESQELVRPTSNTIAIFGADDKAKAGCG